MQTSELPKTYNPKETEDKIYKLWEQSGFFTPENLPGNRKEKFVTMIAPPNITGELHMGHTLELTLQDIIVRMKRMQGFKVLWLPGTDHAGIAAQNVVEKELKKQGLTRYDLGKEKFVEKMWEWKEKYGSLILSQFKKIGISVDWTRLKFTMDPNYQKAVNEVFLYYHKKGWIYQGKRVVNWCPRCHTSISDLEVNYVPEKGKLYFIKYGPFVLATVRPETKLGDTALAVHPKDERYKEYIGKELMIESVDNNLPADQKPQKKTIKILVVADEAVDKEFGTGIIKVTPAHDITDFEISQRHDLSLVKVIDEKGRMSEEAGIRYQGLKTNEARELIVKDLRALGLIEKVEDYDHNVGRCDRCDSVIEPIPSKQWFLKMEELAKLAKEAVEKGETRINPKRWEGPYMDWLGKIRDWNISRQLWWGHKIPIEGQEDVLDTWFSSALWPFVTLGWPNVTSDYKEYYPTHFITSARDILFLWIVRMIFSGKELTGKAPFKDVYIHATVLTKDGKRMSKSLGTGVNPLDLIEKYGTDALRFGLASQATGLQDLRFGEDLLVMGKKFANKLWNISRYVLTKTGNDWTEYLDLADESNSFPISKITGSTSFGGPLRTIFEEITPLLEKYKFGEAANKIYDAIWHGFADQYIENSKSNDDKETKTNLVYFLVNSLKLLHPFMPFITEEIYTNFLPQWTGKKLLMIEKWAEWPLK